MKRFDIISDRTCKAMAIVRFIYLSIIFNFLACDYALICVGLPFLLMCLLSLSLFDPKMQITTITVFSWAGTITRLLLAHLMRIFCIIMCRRLETSWTQDWKAMYATWLRLVRYLSRILTQESVSTLVGHAQYKDTHVIYCSWVWKNRLD